MPAKAPEQALQQATGAKSCIPNAAGEQERDLIADGSGAPGGDIVRGVANVISPNCLFRLAILGSSP